MAYDFKNLNEIEVQDKPTDATTVMAFEGGVPKQIPANGFGGKVIVIDGDDENTFNWDTYECVVNYDPIYETLEGGGTVLLKYTYTSSVGLTEGKESALSWELDITGLWICFWDNWVQFTNGSYHTTA